LFIDIEYMTRFHKIMILLLILFILAVAIIASPKVNEGFGTTAKESEFKKVSIAEPGTGITNVKTNLALREYCIMASYNTALTGKYVNLDMITNVLKRGCRFMDLEVYSVNDAPVVAHSTDNIKFNLDVENTLPLGDVLNRIAGDGFSGSSPNPNDPIFIHLRIKTADDKALQTNISKIIADKLGPRLHKAPPSNTMMAQTPMSQLMGKVIIIVEKSLNSKSPPMKLANMESGRIDFRKYTDARLTAGLITPPNILNDNVKTDVKLMQIVFPDTDTNLDAKQLISDYGVQILANRFYKPDNKLKESEKIFSDKGAAFVPISSMLTYFNQLETEAS
jgi:hypothetical protein